MDEALLERCIRTAKEAGCPKDQAQNFISRSYVPYPWQFRFRAAAREADKPNGPTRIGVGGARSPGKSHAVFAQITLDDLQRYPGLKASTSDKRESLRRRVSTISSPGCSQRRSPSSGQHRFSHFRTALARIRLRGGPNNKAVGVVSNDVYAGSNLLITNRNCGKLKQARNVKSFP